MVRCFYSFIICAALSFSLLMMTALFTACGPKGLTVSELSSKPLTLATSQWSPSRKSTWVTASWDGNLRLGNKESQDCFTIDSSVTATVNGVSAQHFNNDIFCPRPQWPLALPPDGGVDLEFALQDSTGGIVVIYPRAFAQRTLQAIEPDGLRAGVPSHYRWVPAEDERVPSSSLAVVYVADGGSWFSNHHVSLDAGIMSFVPPVADAGPAGVLTAQGAVVLSASVCSGVASCRGTASISIDIPSTYLP